MHRRKEEQRQERRDKLSDVLRINLTTGVISEEDFSAGLVADYLGAKGIGTHFSYERSLQMWTR